MKAIYNGQKYDIESVGEMTYNLKGAGEVSIEDINLYIDEFDIDDYDGESASGTCDGFNVDVWYNQRGKYYQSSGSRTSPPEESYTVTDLEITLLSVEDEWGNCFEHPEYDKENLEGIIIGELNYSYLYL